MGAPRGLATASHGPVCLTVWGYVRHAGALCLLRLCQWEDGRTLLCGLRNHADHLTYGQPSNVFEDGGLCCCWEKAVLDTERGLVVEGPPVGRLLQRHATCGCPSELQRRPVLPYGQLE